MGIFERPGNILRCLSKFRAVLGAPSEYRGPSGSRLGVVLEAPWSRLRGVLGRLGSVLEVSCAILDAIFDSCSLDFASENRSPNLEKSLNSIAKINMFCFQAILT